jgi:hypothetical protein
MPSLRSYPRTLLVGESVEFWVHAQIPWNDAGVDLVAGDKYDFAVLGSQTWKDFSIVSSADGYRSRPGQRIWEHLRRMPAANWLILIGAIGKSMDCPFIIGSRLTRFCPAIPGRLYCFANDVRFMYWNNSGSIKVMVTRSE